MRVVCMPRAQQMTMLTRGIFTLIFVLLAGCSTQPLAPADPEAILANPRVMNEFIVHPAHDVVGEMQVIRAKEEDTLSDIARRFNLGYEELRPLGLFFWGQVWTLCTWCELRNDFRNFRVDRVLGLAQTGETFIPETGKRLEDYVAAYAGADFLAPMFRT